MSGGRDPQRVPPFAFLVRYAAGQGDRMHRHSIHCILPPHVLRSIAERGTEAQRRSALRGLATDGTLRALRAATAPGPRPARSASEAKVQRTIYTAGGRQDLPGTVVRQEGQPDGADPAVNEAYAGLGATFDFYRDVFDRDSIDDEGLPLLATVHFGSAYDNAFWNGSQMVFGDGDGELFHRFTGCLEVIGHELTHGVIEDEAKLAYFHQAGALNEHLADVFGALVKQHRLGQTAAQADWLIGAGLLTERVHGRALRSMKEPGTAFDDPVLGKDPQPAHMRQYVETYEDNGGVHLNSGIPNRAFYLAATGFGGSAWEKAGRVWYETLRDRAMRPSTGFGSFARTTVRVAGALFGSAGADTVAGAWREVGVLRAAASQDAA
jgi:Zn-dependent metalloprotease